MSVSRIGIRFRRALFRRPVAFFLILLAGLALFSGCILWCADWSLRNKLMEEARMAAATLDKDGIRTLTGAPDDLDNPVYLRMKEQFAGIRQAAKQCRFVYLLGRRDDGKVFFFVDNEPLESEAHSPPGQLYEEAPQALFRVFDTRAMAVVGPFSDRWGTWVTALAPIADPETGGLIAVLGMDVDAREWKWAVVARVALPIGLLVALLAGGLAAMILLRGTKRAPRPVLKRLMVPLGSGLIVLFAGVWGLFRQQHLAVIREHVEYAMDSFSEVFQQYLQQQISGMAVALEGMAATPNLRQALAAGDRERLSAVWSPVFEKILKEHGITRFYFIDRDRNCVLRVHHPEKSGGRLERFTVLKAKQTGKMSSGLELGPMGSLAMRAVKPIFEDGGLIGFVELGKEIEVLLEKTSFRFGSQSAIIVNKEMLDRPAWEETMRKRGRVPEWDRLPHGVILYATQGRLPDVFTPAADRPAGNSNRPQAEAGEDIAWEGKLWRTATIPLKEASGREIGILLVSFEVTAMIAMYHYKLMIAAVIGAMVTAILLAVIFVMLRRTDMGLRAQQAQVRNSEEQFRLLFDKMLDGFGLHEIILDGQGRPVDYRWLVVNPAFERHTGLRRSEVVGKTAREVLPHLETEWVDICGRVALTGEPVEFEKSVRDLGKTFAVRAFCPKHGQFACIFVDITERKRMEREVSNLRTVVHHAERVGRAGEISVSLGHELNQPLTGIVTNAEAARMSLDTGAPDLDAIRDILADIVADGKRAGDVIRRLRMYIKNQPLSMELIDVNSTILEILKILRADCVFNGVRMVTELANMLPNVLADRVLLQQIIMNLGMNAQQAMQHLPSGDRIMTVATGLDGEGNVVVSVRDSGTGIPEANMNCIFDFLFTTKAEGMGVGLAVCRSILEAHGGRIWAANNPDRGATISFSLPPADGKKAPGTGGQGTLRMTFREKEE